MGREFVLRQVVRTVADVDQLTEQVIARIGALVGDQVAQVGEELLGSHAERVEPGCMRCDQDRNPLPKDFSISLRETELGADDCDGSGWANAASWSARGWPDSVSRRWSVTCSIAGASVSIVRRVKAAGTSFRSRVG